MVDIYIYMDYMVCIYIYIWCVYSYGLHIWYLFIHTYIYIHIYIYMVFMVYICIYLTNIILYVFGSIITSSLFSRALESWFFYREIIPKTAFFQVGELLTFTHIYICYIYIYTVYERYSLLKKHTILIV